jgi:hypothetical protein
VNSRITPRFRKAFDALPPAIQQRARTAYQRFLSDPNHPSLQFKKVSTEQPVYSVRITLGYRALGLRQGDTITWSWIGTHAEYDRILRDLRSLR